MRFGGGITLWCGSHCRFRSGGCCASIFVAVSRFRLCPSPAQESVLAGHCAQARFVWNLAVEQQSWWRPGRGSVPGFVAQSRQLTEARAEFPWLAAGSQTVQQQALRDHAQAMKHFFAGTHGVLALTGMHLCRLTKR